MTRVSERILRHVLVPAPLSPLPAATPDALGGRTVVLLNGSAELQASLAAAVTRYGGRPVSWDDEAGPAAIGGPVDLIIDAGLTGLGAVVGAGAWREPLARSVRALHAVYPDWSAEPDARRLHYVALTGMGGEMAISPETAAGQPLGGLWAGLAKTLPREFPACAVHVIDIDPAAGDSSDAIVAEIVGGGTIEIGLVGGRRATVLPRWQAAGGQPIRLTSSDVVVFTGGGRGIGFEIALELARDTGCRVIVSGRTRLSDDDGWLAASAEEFAEMKRRAYTRREPGTSPQQVRRKISSLIQAREIAANLARAECAGAKVTYRVCDVTDAADVAALIAHAGDGLAMVVHNAGIDQPARLNKKTVDDVMRVIAIKVDGFFNLLAAIGDRPLKMLCSVGSLTGRYGGMVGQSDYSAANEALARLTTWVAAKRDYPVKCLGWPTWNNLGLITNLDAAARYMAPIDVGQGVAAWKTELLTEGGGEIALLGEVGELGPIQLHGVVIPSNWEGRIRLVSERFFLGEVLRYAPMSVLETAHCLDPSWASCLQDAAVPDAGRDSGAPAGSGERGAGAGRGSAAMPLSLIVEYLVRGASWLFVPGHAQDEDQELHDVRIWPQACDPVDGPVRMIRRAAVTGSGQPLRIEVGLWRVTDAGESLLGTCSVSPYQDGDPARAEAVHAEAGVTGAAGNPAAVGEPDAAGPVTAGPGDPPTRALSAAYSWRPYDSEVRGWTADGPSWLAQVGQWWPTDMFSLIEPPEPALPLAHLEVVAAISPVTAPGAIVWSAKGARWRRAAGAGRSVSAATGANRACVLGESGQPVLFVEGASWSLGIV